MKRNCLCLILAGAIAAGCTTKSKAKADARAAFEAGQRQAYGQALDQRRINLRFLGPVRNPEVVWSTGLTLGQAIAAAGYNETRDPQVITIIRQRERVEVSPRSC